MQLGEPTGVTANIVAECLGHMKCWVRLALGVAKAEFPDFAVLNAFSCLRLPTSNQGARAAPNHDTLSHLIESKEGANTESKLHALADLFELPRDEVVAQVMDVKSLAAAIKENGEATGDKQAYDLAIAKYSRRHNRELHPTASPPWLVSSAGFPEQGYLHHLALAAWNYVSAGRSAELLGADARYALVIAGSGSAKGVAELTAGQQCSSAAVVRYAGHSTTQLHQ